MFLLLSSFFHLFSRRPRNSWLKGPQYDRKADASKTLPTNLEQQKSYKFIFLENNKNNNNKQTKQTN